MVVCTWPSALPLYLNSVSSDSQAIIIVGGASSQYLKAVNSTQTEQCSNCLLITPLTRKALRRNFLVGIYVLGDQVIVTVSSCSNCKGVCPT